MEKGLLPEIAAELYEAVPLTSPLLSHRLGWQGAMRRCDRLLLRRPRGAAIEKATTRNWSWGRGWRGTGLRSSWVQPWRPGRRQAGVFGVLEGLDVDAYARPDGGLPSVPQSHIVKLSALALGRGVVRRPLERTCTLSLRMTRAFGNCCMNILCGPEGAAVPGPRVRRELGQMAGQLLERDPLVRLHSPLQKFDRGVAPVAPSLRHGWQAEEATEREGAASGQTRTAEKVRWRLAKAKNSAQ